MSKQNQNTKKHFYELSLNNGERKKFYYDRWCEREGAISDYVAEKMKDLEHFQPFTPEELRLAPWMVTQSDLLTKTEFCSLEQLASKAYLQCQHLIRMQVSA